MDTLNSRPDSNLVWAILCTIFCCLPLGIVAIVYAAKVDSLYNSGNYEEAQRASDKARKFSIYGALAGVAVGVIYAVIMFGAVALGAR